MAELTEHTPTHLCICIYLVCPSNWTQFQQQTILTVSAYLNSVTYVHVFSSINAHLLVELDIFLCGVFPYRVPTQKLHRRKNLFNWLKICNCAIHGWDDPITLLLFGSEVFPVQRPVITDNKLKRITYFDTPAFLRAQQHSVHYRRGKESLR